MKQAKSAIIGILIIALGVILGGNALGLFSIDIFFKGWWTLFIIIPCFLELITEKNKVSSLIGIAVGVLLLLAAQDVFSFELAGKLILALIVIVIGFSIAFKGFFKSDKGFKKLANANKDKHGIDTQVAVFSGSDRVYKNEEFTGADLTAIFGGVELDLLDAKFTKDTEIKAFCLFGGISIKLPKDVKVKSKSGFAFGGLSDDREDVSEKAKYPVYIETVGGFGGVSIEDKRDE